MYNIMKVEINNYVPIPLFTTSLQFDSNAPEFKPRSKSFPLFVTTTLLNPLVVSAAVTDPCSVGSLIPMIDLVSFKIPSASTTLPGGFKEEEKYFR